jgi:hypothetical protein
MARKPSTKKPVAFDKPDEKPAIPLNQQPGRCKNCGAGAPFRYAIVDHNFIRSCINCDWQYDVDNGVVVNSGDPAKTWRG